MKYLLAAVVALFASQAWAVDRYVSVSGNGHVEVVPDMATIDINAVTESLDVKTAVKDNATRMKNVMKYLTEEAQIDKSDICTHGFSVHQYENNKYVAEWTARNNILVTIKDVSKAGDVLSGISKSNSVVDVSATFELRLK